MTWNTTIIISTITNYFPEHDKVTTYFKERLPLYKIHELGFREKLWLYKSYLWYSFLIQDFLACYKYSKKWVNLFDEYPTMIRLNPG